MVDMQSTLREAIVERGRSHSPWSGAVRMADGQDYYGTVWKLDGCLYVFYRNEPVAVRWKCDRYVVA